MTSERNLPEGWVLETERTIHDEFMGREYTTVLYRQDHTRNAVYITEVIDGKNVWEYDVHHSGQGGDFGTAADLETAKEMAFRFMNESVTSV
jgi:hypothetical protein